MYTTNCHRQSHHWAWQVGFQYKEGPQGYTKSLAKRAGINQIEWSGPGQSSVRGLLLGLNYHQGHLQVMEYEGNLGVR